MAYSWHFMALQTLLPSLPFSLSFFLLSHSFAPPPLRPFNPLHHSFHLSCFSPQHTPSPSPCLMSLSPPLSVSLTVFCFLPRLLPLLHHLSVCSTHPFFLYLPLALLFPTLIPSHSFTARHQGSPVHSVNA